MLVLVLGDPLMINIVRYQPHWPIWFNLIGGFYCWRVKYVVGVVLHGIMRCSTAHNNEAVGCVSARELHALASCLNTVSSPLCYKVPFFPGLRKSLIQVLPICLNFSFARRHSLMWNISQGCTTGMPAPTPAPPSATSAGTVSQGSPLMASRVKVGRHTPIPCFLSLQSLPTQPFPLLSLSLLYANASLIMNAIFYWCLSAVVWREKDDDAVETSGWGQTGMIKNVVDTLLSYDMGFALLWIFYKPQNEQQKTYNQDK